MFMKHSFPFIHEKKKRMSQQLDGVLSSFCCCCCLADCLAHHFSFGVWIIPFFFFSIQFPFHRNIIEIFHVPDGPRIDTKCYLFNTYFVVVKFTGASRAFIVILQFHVWNSYHLERWHFNLFLRSLRLKHNAIDTFSIHDGHITKLLTVHFVKSFPKTVISRRNIL